MRITPQLFWFASALLLPLCGLSAQTVFDNGGGDNLWSNATNWDPEDVPDGTADTVRLQGDPIVDGSFTVGFLQNAFGSSDITVSGAGTLTIDRDSATAGDGLRNVAGNPGSRVTFSGNVTVDNTQGGITRFGYANSNSNGFEFASSSVLTLTDAIETATDGAGRYLTFNGAISGGTSGAGNLRIGADDENITFGSTADNTGYAGDIVFFANASVVSNTSVAGGFLSSGSKVQVNGDGSTLTLGGAGGMQGNLVVDGTNAFTLDVDADQTAFGFINFSGASPAGEITIDLDSAVSALHFADSSGQDWGASTISVSGFRESTIRFGTDAGGLTSSQLSAIDGGLYTLTGSGYLTAIPEPRDSALMLGTAVLAGLLLIRRRRA
ncbi:MAG: hypothetical protein ACFE0O_10700 [Opitutales bacterium]